MKPRWWAKLRADFGGYFWLPCPVCGRMFGGHEWDYKNLASTVPTEVRGLSKAICPSCTRNGYGVDPTGAP
jgi:hypothetical protein